jgi:hypothetical protein
MTSRGPFPAWDLALLSGSTYGGLVYMGDAAGTGTSVGSAASPVVGGSYCSSGATTFEQCGKVVQSLSGAVCDASGCTYNLAATQAGGYIGPGDSGGPPRRQEWRQGPRTRRAYRAGEHNHVRPDLGPGREPFRSIDCHQLTGAVAPV